MTQAQTQPAATADPAATAQAAATAQPAHARTLARTRAPTLLDHRERNDPLAGVLARAVLHRAATDVALTGAKLSPKHVSVPPEKGLAVKIAPVPANATAVTFGIEKGTVDPSATTVSATGEVTVGAAQPGGDISVFAEGTTTDDEGATTTVKQPETLTVSEKPTSLKSTSAVEKTSSTEYGGEFTHTFSGPGKASGLADAVVNEKFDSLTPTTPFGTFTLSANAANSAGWGLDSSGAMTAPDNVTIDKKLINVQEFVKSTSNPKPKSLPAKFSMTQHLFAKSFPSKALDATEFDKTEHVRRLEKDSNGALKVVTEAGKDKVTQDYDGKYAITNAKSSASSVVGSQPKPKPVKGQPTPDWDRNTFTVSADTIPADGSPIFTITGATLGCEIDKASGEVKVGSTPGTVAVRVYDPTKTHYDEVAVTITKP
jgi:hypothetical protein